jgi:predicted ABC-type sugar transport system permease subunit
MGTPPTVTPGSALAGAARTMGAVRADVRTAQLIRQARTIVTSGDVATLRSAAQAGVQAEVQIAGRTVVYSPEMSASGMTLFGESGFVLGRQAFASSRELVKTVLHELHRLNTSAAASGVGGATAAAETAAAAGFADRAYNIGRLLRIW